jgi:hypothetical protein
MKVSTIADIKAGKAAEFKVDKQYPSKTELQETFRKLEENAMIVPCLENEYDKFGSAVLLCKETDWKQYHASKQTQANEVAGATSPALPTFPNPGRFNLDESSRIVTLRYLAIGQSRSRVRIGESEPNFQRIL